MQVHRSHRMERLVDVLAEVVRTPAAGTLQPETILIQSKGMERWLSNELARRLGVFANARFPFPRLFIDQIYDDIVPLPAGSHNHYSREVLAFTTLGLLDEMRSDSAFASIAGYLDDDPSELKRFQLAERIAHVFDQYLVYRPAMLLRWERGMGADWQPKLWRALSQRLGGEHFAKRTERFFHEWSPLLFPKTALPKRVSVVGVNALPPIYLKVLNQLSELCDVQVFALSPSGEYFAQTRSLREVVHSKHGHKTLDFDDEQLEALQGNPLLASLGRTGRQFQFTLERDTVYRETERDLFHSQRARSLLEMLQHDIAEMRDHSLSEAEKHSVSPDDSSLAVISCHSPFREVEVLRDQLLDLLERDRSLQAGDILVMSPNIDSYAPLIDAVFGIDPQDASYIPFSIADRSERSHNLCAKALTETLLAVQGRMAASEVLDLLQLEPIRRRFEIEAEQLADLGSLVHRAGIRWGIDAEHRASFRQPSDASNTWRFGLDRLLLGVALPESADQLFMGRAPMGDVEGDGAELVGKLAQFVDLLVETAAHIQAARPVAEWANFLTALADRLLKAEETEAWQRRALFDAIYRIAQHAGQAGYDAEVGLEPILSQLIDHFDTERVSHQFLAGGVTFCALLPMRSIPFKVIVMLGMNDGDFPRVEKALSFDLVSKDPKPGDRSLKDEDRYLFLETVLSARQHLRVSYVGRGVQDAAELPPSPVVSELLDYVRGAFRCRGEPVEPLVEHPLQPFSPRYFRQPTERGLFSFATAEAEGARSLSRRRGPTRPFLASPLAAVEPSRSLTVEDLIRFLQNPARGFLQNRLGVYFEEQPRLVENREPIELDPLQRYELGNRLLEHALAGDSRESVESVVEASGALPHGVPGSLLYTDVWAEAREISERARGWLDGERPPPLSVACQFGDTELTGNLRQLFPRAQLYWQFARVKPKNEVALWVRHLLLHATGDQERVSVLVGRPLEAAQPDTATCVFAPLPRDEARERLCELVALYHQGHQKPLPLFPAASKVFVQTLLRHQGPDARAKALSKAREEFAPSYPNGHPESEDDYVMRAFEGLDPLTTGDRHADGSLHELDFMDLSQRVFEPMLRFRKLAGAA